MKIYRDSKKSAINVMLFSALMVFLLCGCQSFEGGGIGVLTEDNVISEDSDGDKGAALFNELGGEKAFVDLAQYLYRWYLDEDDFKERNPGYRGQLWIRRIEEVLDEGDQSQFLELAFPAIGVTVTLKKSDYMIEELKLEVKSDGYKITKIDRVPLDMMGNSRDYATLNLDIAALYEKLFATRLEAEYPDQVLFEHLRACAVEQCRNLTKDKSVSEPQTVWMAPLSTLANESWMYWEDRRILFRFVSDVDIQNKKVWDYDHVAVVSHDIITQTIVSYEEAPGDDSFMTRDQVGRILYNCMAFGKKIKIESNKQGQ